MMGAGALTDKAVVMIELPARLGGNGYLDAGEGGASARATRPQPPVCAYIRFSEMFVEKC